MSQPGLAARPRPSYKAPVPTTNMGLPSKREFVSSGFVHDGGDKGWSGHTASVSTSFTGLNADEADLNLENLGDGHRVADHLAGEGNFSGVV